VVFFGCVLMGRSGISVINPVIISWRFHMSFPYLYEFPGGYRTKGKSSANHGFHINCWGFPMIVVCWRMRRCICWKRWRHHDVHHLPINYDRCGKATIRRCFSSRMVISWFITPAKYD
jgi:hypothetical protein